MLSFEIGLENVNFNLGTVFDKSEVTEAQSGNVGDG